MIVLQRVRLVGEYGIQIVFSIHKFISKQERLLINHQPFQTATSSQTKNAEPLEIYPRPLPDTSKNPTLQNLIMESSCTTRVFENDKFIIE